jgi:cytoskeletal protein RodZ
VEDFQEDAADVIPEPVIVAEENATDEDEIATAEEPEEIENTEEAIEPDDEQPAATLQDIVSEIEDDEPEAEVEETVEESAEETEAEAAPVSKFHQMRMVLSGPSWVEIKKGDKTVLRGSVYKRGFSYNIPQEEGLTITVGRPRSATFYVDDKPVKVVSVLNNKRVSLDSFLIKTNN